MHLLRLPSDPRSQPSGGVHASALLALAEASSGEFLLRHFGSSEGIVPVVRRLESKFRSRERLSDLPRALRQTLSPGSPAISHPRVVA